MNPEEMLALWIEGELDPKKHDELLHKLANNDAFAEKAAQQLLTHRMLGSLRVGAKDFTNEVLLSIRESENHPASVSPGVIARIQKCRGRQRRLLWSSIGLAATLVMAFFGLQAIGLRESRAKEVAILAAEGVGSLDVRSLRAGRQVVLEHGILEFTLGAYTRLVIEAPARFTIASRERVRMERGRCYAEMEKGKSGLRIVTPSGGVLDLGTRFGVEVGADQKTAVHVFEGEVELGKNARLKEGEGVNWLPTGDLESVPLDADRFVHRLPGRKADKAAFLQWHFDEGEGMETIAVGKGFAGARHAAQIHGAQWTEGMSGTALSFDGLDDWVETFIQGLPPHRDRTVACWIRLSPQNAQSTVRTLVGWGNYDVREPDRQHGSVWELAIRNSESGPELNGRLQLNLGGPMTVSERDLRDGQWHHVAAVSLTSGDPKAGGTILLYVDGVLEPRTFGRGSFDIPDGIDAGLDEFVQFGRGVIHRHVKGRYFQGEMDEVFIIDAALSGDEIRQLMKTHQMAR